MTEFLVVDIEKVEAGVKLSLPNDNEIIWLLSALSVGTQRRIADLVEGIPWAYGVTEENSWMIRLILEQSERELYAHA